MHNSLGPYLAKNGKIIYIGNKIFAPIKNVAGIHPSSLEKRYLDIGKNANRWAATIKIWDEIFNASVVFMKQNRAYLFDLPITTRMISSPGALTGTILSDVRPFKIDFFGRKTFLTQSSQLYLEFAICNQKIDKVFCWEKSFRMERADYRHLPEFTHIEFEGNIDFYKNLEFQEKFLKFLIAHILNKCGSELLVFLKKNDISVLRKILRTKFKHITFFNAFKLLYEQTGDAKYRKVTLKNFNAYDEILLTQFIGAPVFVTNYIEDEVAFYHASDARDGRFVLNADLLFPGYGELIGSGERVHTKKEIKRKAQHFKLNMQDYKSYINSRSQNNSRIHSGWGMGIERLIHSILKLPFIWETKPFPRVDGQSYP